MANLQIFKIDDSDSAIAYAGKWHIQSNPAAFLSTLHLTESRGSSVQFTFNGTSVSAYGSVELNASIATYSLDGGTPMPLDLTSNTITPGLNESSLFNSGNLRNGKHVLVINTTVDGSTLSLDYLQVTATQNENPFLPTSVSLKATSSTSVSPKSASPKTHHGVSSIITVTVVVVCSVVVIAAVTAALVYRRRHRRRLEQPKKARKQFDLLPSETSVESPPQILEILRMKNMLGQRPGSEPRTRTQTTQPSTTFTSVIFAPPISDRSSAA